MVPTSLTLLERLRTGASESDWRRLTLLYEPVIRRWLRSVTTDAARDLDDLTQEILTDLVRGIPRFVHNGRTGAFRRWLRTVVTNRIRQAWQQRRPTVPLTAELLQNLDDPTSELSRMWDRAHDEQLVRRALDAIAGDFAPTTWLAFQRLAWDEWSAATVAQELGVSINAVLLAKSRVLRRLRQELAGLFD